MSLKTLYLVKIWDLTHFQDKNTKVKFKLRILEKIHVGSETNWKVGSGSGSGYDKKTFRILF